MLFFSLLHLFLTRYLSHVNPLVHEKHLCLQGNRIVRLHDGNLFGREKGDHTLPRKFTRFRQNDHLVRLTSHITHGLCSEQVIAGETVLLSEAVCSDKKLIDKKVLCALPGHRPHHHL